MKRSEMIENIARILRGCYPQYLDNQSNYSVRIDAEYILKAIENYGMLPPRWIPEDHGYTYSDEPSGEPNGFKVSVFKWEPEND